jgi:hypothetical protein
MLKELLMVALALGFALPAHAGGPPPSIDDLDGSTFSVRASGPEYDLAGGRGKFDDEIQWKVTKTGATTVSFDAAFGGMIFTANYVDGFLLQAYASGQVPPADGSSMYLSVSGKPGKLKLKGALTIYSAGPGFMVLRVLKVSGKQIP